MVSALVPFIFTMFSLLPAWSPEDEYPAPRTPDTEEYNILYVAVTRAKKSLILTRALSRVLRDAGVSITQNMYKILAYISAIGS